MARHSSLSSLDHQHHPHSPSTFRPLRRRLTSTGSTCSGSTANLSATYAPTTTRRDYIASSSTSPISLSAMQNQHHPLTTYRRLSTNTSSAFDDTTSRFSSNHNYQHRHSSYLRSPSVPDSDSSATSILSTHASDSRKSITDSPHSLKNVSFSGDAVDAASATNVTATASRRRYDSPAEIIAALFPESVKVDTNRRKSSSTLGSIGATSSSSLRKASVSSASSRVAVARPVSAVVSNPPWLGAGSSGVLARRASSSFSVGAPNNRSATAAKRGIYRPDSLQTLDRDFDGLKYD